ncbi:winged helix-turn-helix domain-containing protein [Alphaproteobacteria bacterium]|nr:winged helix-turn-helix domain-containing protein [Alphaproteobacteria bacterium]
MKSGPDIAKIAALVGDPARANMLTALMTGYALTARELSEEAGVTPATTSSHLSKLEEGGLVKVDKQGRHRYYQLADDQVASVLEGLMGLAARNGLQRVRPGPKDPAMREARVCYDHLAGDMGVALYDGLLSRGIIEVEKDTPLLTKQGEAFAADFGIDLSVLSKAKRPVCKACLDWSNRRSHLAGGMGAALLHRIYDLGWAKRVPDSRVVSFSTKGAEAFKAQFN